MNVSLFLNFLAKHHLKRSISSVSLILNVLTVAMTRARNTQWKNKLEIELGLMLETRKLRRAASKPSNRSLYRLASLFYKIGKGPA